MSYSILLPNGARFTMLPSVTNYHSEEGFNRWARRGKRGNMLHSSSGLKPMNDKDAATEAQKRYLKRKGKECVAETL